MSLVNNTRSISILEIRLDKLYRASSRQGNITISQIFSDNTFRIYLQPKLLDLLFFYFTIRNNNRFKTRVYIIRYLYQVENNTSNGHSI